MSKKETKNQEPVQETPKDQASPQTEEPVEQPQGEQAAPPEENDPLLSELEALKDQNAQQEDKYLRLAAEYDNYRRRTTKEKESIWNDAKADAALAFLPVYDNLERALKQETADEAYKKGVEMTMNQLVKVMEGLGVTSFGEIGEAFDPARHNAVMHVEEEGLGDNVIAEVFQKGFLVGEKVIRFAMVKVAN